MINVKMQSAEPVQHLSPKIAVIGVGGAGGNAVNNMISSNLDGCEFLACNTDAQALEHSLAEHKVQLGVSVTGGLGAGSKPEIGQAAAEESLEDVLRYLDGANMAFVTAGMGGGTGTGAAPVIAKACRQQGILTVGVITKPFHFEGVHRMEQAEKGIEELQQYVDTLLVIPNQNLFRIANEKTTFAEAFKMADTVLQSGVRGVTDLMVRPGLVNLDFADIKTAMMQMGKAMMGTGEASGDKRAIEAAESAINNPLLDDVSMKGANGVIINVTGGYDMTLFEADEACNRIRDEVDSSANIIFGATFDETMDGIIRVSIVATGIEKETVKKVSSSGKTSITISGNSGTKEAPPSTFGQTQTSVQRSIPTPPAEKKPMAALSGRDVIRGLTAPAPIKQESKSAEPERQAPQASASMDMFEQGDFSPKADGFDRASGPALRGGVVGNAFIPPKPMDPVEKTMQAKEQEGHVRAMRPSSLQLNPPKTGYHSALSQERPARTPSLLERITGSVQHHIEQLRDEGDALKARNISSPLHNDKIETGSAQKSLDISSPAAKPAMKIDDELDIPAFLRRQAN